MHYLVTGAAGFIGFHVTERLLAAGHQVTGLDNLNDYYDVNLKLSRLALLQTNPVFRFVKGDLADRALIASLFAEGHFQRVIHFTDWVVGHSHLAMLGFASFAAAGCTAQIVDITPDIDARQRHLEVAAWLAQQAEPPHRFVVIDDDFDMPDFPDRLVRTRKHFGLGARELPAVLQLLAD